MFHAGWQTAQNASWHWHFVGDGGVQTFIITSPEKFHFFYTDRRVVTVLVVKFCTFWQVSVLVLYGSAPKLIVEDVSWYTLCTLCLHNNYQHWNCICIILNSVCKSALLGGHTQPRCWSLNAKWILSTYPDISVTVMDREKTKPMLMFKLLRCVQHSCRSLSQSSRTTIICISTLLRVVQFQWNTWHLICSHISWLKIICV